MLRAMYLFLKLLLFTFASAEDVFDSDFLEIARKIFVRLTGVDSLSLNIFICISEM